MFEFKSFPLRQKILLGLTVFSGLFLLLCNGFNLLSQNMINQLILVYGMGIPLLLLTFDTVLDLNQKHIFSIWLTIATIIFIISLFTYDTDKFIFHRSSKFDNSNTINTILSKYSTSSLKTLLTFLVTYWLINKLFYRKEMFVINTFKQRNWYHDIAQRKILWLDVLVNIFLYAVIIAAGLFGY